MERIKRIMCLGLAVSIVFSICCRQVKAEEIIEMNVETVEEIIDDYDKELAEIDEMYRNLEITLPEEEFVWEEEKKTVAVNSNARAIISVPAGVCTSGTSTNTDLVWSMDTANNFEGSTVRESTLKEEFYTFGPKVKTSFVLPGMKTTNVNGASCSDMTPQGITYYDGYYFITAYCGNTKFFNDKISEHDSVIYVIKGTTKKLITTLVIKDKDNGETPHVGGIAYANGYLWLGATEKILFYDYDEIKEAIVYAENHPIVKSIYIGNYTNGEMTVDGGFASFITTYKGYLVLGTYDDSLLGTGYLRFCYPNAVDNGTFGYISKWELPKKAQGMAFFSDSNYTYMIINTSRGASNSKVYVYRTSGKLYSGVLTLTKSIYMPCYLEEAVTVEGYTYFVFESCAEQYRNGFIPVIGKVCGMDNAFIYK